MVNKEQYDKVIGIREYSEQFSRDCFQDPISVDTGTPDNSIPLLSDVGDEDPVATCHCVYFANLCSFTIQDSPTSDPNIPIFLSPASSLSITSLISQHILSVIENKLRGKSKRFHKGYCSGMLTNVNRFCNISLWFFKG